MHVHAQRLEDAGLRHLSAGTADEVARMAAFLAGAVPTHYLARWLDAYERLRPVDDTAAGWLTYAGQRGAFLRGLGEILSAVLRRTLREQAPTETERQILLALDALDPGPLCGAGDLFPLYAWHPAVRRFFGDLMAIDR
jgi:hypothetical protein